MLKKFLSPILGTLSNFEWEVFWERLTSRLLDESSLIFRCVDFSVVCQSTITLDVRRFGWWRCWKPESWQLNPMNQELFYCRGKSILVAEFLYSNSCRVIGRLVFGFRWLVDEEARFGFKSQARQCTSKLWDLKLLPWSPSFCSALNGR